MYIYTLQKASVVHASGIPFWAHRGKQTRVHKWQASSSGNTQRLHGNSWDKTEYNPFQFICYPLYFFCFQFIANTIIYLVTGHMRSYCPLEGAILVTWQIMVWDRMLFFQVVKITVCAVSCKEEYCISRNNPSVQLTIRYMTYATKEIQWIT